MESLSRWRERSSSALSARDTDGQSAEPLARICSAELYDDVFAEVRRRICDGESFASIQSSLDDRFRGANPPLRLAKTGG